MDAKRLQEAHTLINKMRAEGMTPGQFSYDVLMYACARENDGALLVKILYEVCASFPFCGLEARRGVSHGALGRHWGLVSTRKGSQTLTPTSRQWREASLVGVYLTECTGGAFRLDGASRQMRGMNMSPSDHLYHHLLLALCASEEYEEVFRLWEEYLATGMRPAQQIFNSVILAYSKTGQFDKALKVRASFQFHSFAPSSPLFPELLPADESRAARTGRMGADWDQRSAWNLPLAPSVAPL
jgi:pentatricopeptide repeat protein